MSFQLVVKPDAENDILESANHYEELQENLGLRFLDEIDDKLHLILNNSV